MVAGVACKAPDNPRYWLSLIVIVVVDGPASRRRNTPRVERVSDLAQGRGASPANLIDHWDDICGMSIRCDLQSLHWQIG